MNEGESAGGGHQGTSLAPPAVSDRNPTIPPTPPVATAISSNFNQSLPSTITIVTTNGGTITVPSATATTSSASSKPRSFQQVFTQTQLQHHQKQNPGTTVSNTSSIPRISHQSSSHSHNQLQSSARIIGGLIQKSVTTQSSTRSQTPNLRESSFINSTSGVGIPVVVSTLITKQQKVENTENLSVNKTSSIVSSVLPSGSTSEVSRPAVSSSLQDSNSLKKRILEQKYQRLRSLKERHSENVAELFYLHSGGNMTEYPGWRKKPTTPQFATFSNTYRLDKLIAEDKTNAVSSYPHPHTVDISSVIGGNSCHQPQQPVQQGARSPTVTPIKTNSRSQSQIPDVPTTACSSVSLTLGSPVVNSASACTIEANDNVLPQGAEIKIPSVGATPVAVSTKLPAAVVQLTQQGGTPLIPCPSGSGTTTLRRNANGITQSTASTTGDPIATTSPPTLYSSSSGGLLIPMNPPASGSAVSSGGAGGGGDGSGGSGDGVVPAGNLTATGSCLNNAQEFSFKAKQEVYVMQRISELQREGLWTEKRLPKLQEPSRPKAHWDYLLEEMVWLAADFAQERKWKKNAAKKCAKMVQKYFQDKANAAQKAEKAQEIHLKRIAAFISKEIKMFWSNVEKLVEYKHHTKLEEKRKKALDQHLSFIVDQTEKFSQQLAEGMNKGIKDCSVDPSCSNPKITASPKHEPLSDDEFRPDTASEDDEETIAKAEAEAADVKEEVDALAIESQMDLDDFIDKLPKGYLENRDKIIIDEKSGKDDESDDTEFEANEASEDDENTISKQEETEMDVDHKKELDELEADNDLTVEQLMEKYKTDKGNEPPDIKTKIKVHIQTQLDSDDDEVDSDIDEDSSDANISSEATTDDETTTVPSDSDADEKGQGDGLKSLIEDTDANSDDMIKDAAALAESIQPKGNTLSSTNVVTPVPFLLKHSLREYQHIGLDWLVTMNERKLNGILADEMGLGKTIQTIALLAHLACEKGNWGPHLIVVPSSVMLNWEMEFKKWCPGFKILTYYGAQKERKAKRVGWTKPNAFHVCITSYKLVVQDQQSFRRKKWKYLILDEAQNIKNFKSQRWQLLLNFSTERRLLLTGTPLQNDMMELWSLMHFLMPYVFSSHREFKEWFSNPMTGMIEGNMEYNESLINRLHKVIRPFLLRRLKKEVEKQMPKKYEHVVMCRLSNRQRYLYDDFMGRAKTKETLQTGNLLSVINVLMQLRKVCNHPNMFEVRPTISPFNMEGISYRTSRLVADVLEYKPLTEIDLRVLNIVLIQLEVSLTAYVSYKSRLLAPPEKFIEEVDLMPPPPPICPTGKYKFYVRVRDNIVQQSVTSHNANAVRVGSSPTMKTEGNKLVPVRNLDPTNSKLGKRVNHTINPVYTIKPVVNVVSSNRISTATISSVTLTPSQLSQQSCASATKIAKVMQGGKPYFVLTSKGHNAISDVPSTSARVTLVCKGPPLKTTTASTVNVKVEKANLDNNELVNTLAEQVKTTTKTVERMQVDNEDERDVANVESVDNPIYNMSEVLQKRKEMRLSRLKFMASVNSRRIEAVPIYGSDCRDSLKQCVSPNHLLEYSSWQTRGYINCRAAMERRDNWTLNKMLKTYEKRCDDLHDIFAKFIIYVPSACAPQIQFHTQHLTSTRILCEREIANTLTKNFTSKLTLLHPIISPMMMQFPDPRLIQYDCGKLQTLDQLLRQLKSGQHRVLIFTQMTKMLDVLEAFLNYHGHIYLRLDGSTRVEQRQILMERFNGDKRIFCFILSTRSGGVGINLTGADTVIFYDSDWNPTMDAQAQDRCHRIGQTRDVHIYRLVSEKTIEVNILQKANQKRMLSDMAIEGGNFTTSYFKSSTIKDLFNMEQEQDVDSNKSEKSSTTFIPPLSNDSAVEADKQSLRVFESALAAAEDEQDVQATKIARAEAAADLAEFDETIPIDEQTTEGYTPALEMSKADIEMQNLVKQLSPIERYAMRFVEETGAAWTAEQLRAAEEEIEAQKREWEANRLAAIQKEEEMLKQETDVTEMLTYNRRDASNKIWISDNTKDQMPMWCPPTPPQDDNDIYVDYSLTFMYDITPIPDTDLPPIFVRRECKRSRSEAGFLLESNRRSPKIRKEDNFHAPRSLFDRPSTAIARIRRDLKHQRYRGVFKPNIQIPGLKPPIPPKVLTEQEGMAEWCIFEDIVILHVLINLQGLPCNLMLLSPGHTPNWDLVAETVNIYSKTHRSPKQCRWRYESVIQPREEGKLIESPKKQKKLKTGLKLELLKGPLRCLRTSQLYASDNNSSFTKLMRSRFDCIKTVYSKKPPVIKRHFTAPVQMNPKHLEVLQEFGINNYDQPITPLNIAALKASKLREKHRAQLPPPPSPAPCAPNAQQGAIATPIHSQQTTATLQQQQQMQEIVQQTMPASAGVTPTATSMATPIHGQQLQIQHLATANVGGTSQQPTAATIVLQHAPTVQQTHQQQNLSTPSSQTQSQLMRSAISGHAATTQIVKIAPQSGLLTTGQMQHLTQQAAAAAAGSQHVQLQQTGGGNLVGAPASVSVVLTTPVQTLSSNGQPTAHGTGQVSATQIVSIAPQTIMSSSTQMGSIVQTLPSQSLPQVVSVSQLANVGTVLTTSSNLQPSATVTTLNPNALRAQRIVATTSGTLQDVVLQQRSGTPGPTIVSMSSLGQTVSPAQFQATQLRLTPLPGTTQQVVTKNIPVGSLQQAGKITPGSLQNQPAHIQLYRQRQQLKLLQTAPGQGNQTVVQTASGQATLVNAAGSIIQGSLLQGGPGSATVQVQGQKVAVATVPTSNTVTAASGITSVATVQVAHNQGRTQFIKQMPNKQAIARQVGDNDMLLVKRQVINAHQKPQMLQQGQIFTTTSGVVTNVQLHQTQSPSVAVAVNAQQQGQIHSQTQAQQVTQQQIATLVKTSTGAIATATSSGCMTMATGSQTQGTVNMALSHLKPGGQIKVTMANQPQMRQLNMQQHLTMPRKISRMTQIATAGQGATANVIPTGGQQVGGSTAQGAGPITVASQKNALNTNVQTQLVHLQNTKPLPASVTVQQIQQVMRQGQPPTLAAGLVLGKTSVGRVIPVSVGTQPNQRQTIQVVSAASAQALASGNIRAHVTGGQNITGTIKVAGAGSSQAQTQQALINAIQQQAAAQQNHRQNPSPSPVRLQTTAGGNLVAVVQPQTLQQQQTVVSVANSATSGQGDAVMTITATPTGTTSLPAQQQAQQQATTQQVRTLVKKKIMQIRSEKE